MSLPWWLNFTLAIVFYCLGLLYLVPSLASGRILKALPFLAYAHYILPAAFLFTGTVSFFRARYRRSLLNRQENLNTIRSLSWIQFERLVGEYYRRKGYRVVENAGSGADGGVDLIITKNGRRALVQCKQWQNQKVGVKTVREMYGLLAADPVAEEVIIITSGSFSPSAVDFSTGKAINLVNGLELENMIIGLNAPMEKTTSSSMECPRCHNKLVLRTARKGTQAGRSFLGCSAFPKCRYTRNT